MRTLLLVAAAALVAGIHHANANPVDDNMDRSCMLAALTKKSNICTELARDCGSAMQGIPNDRACFSKAQLICYAWLRSKGKPLDSDDFRGCVDKTMDKLTKEHPGHPVE